MRETTSKVYCTFQDSPGHQYRGHPESPIRLKLLRNWLTCAPYPEMTWLDFEPASEGDLMLVHSNALIEAIRSESKKGPIVYEPAPTYLTPNTYDLALAAVGATLKVSRKILNSDAGKGFAIVRPPGHHSDVDHAMGFCIFNNLAIAAADAVTFGVNKVAIIDFDAHHGNGTQGIFWNTPEVGYLSTHGANTYPGSGHIESARHALARIVNVPVPSFSGKQMFMAILDEIILPWLVKFQPEMIFVSAGYDGHFSDPLTTLTLDTQFYYTLTKRLVDWAEANCNGRIMYVLEGGYDSIALSDNIQASLAAMCGQIDFPDHYGDKLGPIIEIENLIQDIKAYHHL